MSIALAYWRDLLLEGDADRGYARVQEFAATKQLPALRWVEERESLDRRWPERSLGSALRSMQDGDHLLVTRMLMLANSMAECCQIIAYLLEKRIYFYALDALCHLDRAEHFPVWRHALTIFQQFQQQVLSESTKRGIRKRRERGLPIGRPIGSGRSNLDEYRDEIAFLLAHGATQKFIVDHYDTSRSHLNYWLKRRGVKSLSASGK
jgi:DNA invertase Pin-like site-specific DNA recombinase